MFAVALAMGETFAHVLEAGPKATLPADQYLVVQLHLYQHFGPAASVLEPLALLASIALVILVRQRPLPFWTSALAVVCVIGMLISFAVGNAPINQEQAGWTTTSLPANWREVRDSWELFHAASFGLATMAFTALLVGMLYDSRLAGRS